MKKLLCLLVGHHVKLVVDYKHGHYAYCGKCAKVFFP